MHVDNIQFGDKNDENDVKRRLHQLSERMGNGLLILIDITTKFLMFVAEVMELCADSNTVETRSTRKTVKLTESPQNSRINMRILSTAWTGPRDTKCPLARQKKEQDPGQTTDINKTQRRPGIPKELGKGNQTK